MNIYQILKLVKDNDYEKIGLIKSSPRYVDELIQEIKKNIPCNSGSYFHIRSEDSNHVFILFEHHILIWLIGWNVKNILIELDDLDQDEFYNTLKYGKILQEEVNL